MNLKLKLETDSLRMNRLNVHTLFMTSGIICDDPNANSLKAVRSPVAADVRMAVCT